MPNCPHASGPVLQWVRMLSGRSLGRGQRLEAERREPAVVDGGLRDDRVGLRPERVGDGPAIVGQVADRLVAGHHPVDRPAQVDRRRAGLDEGVGPAPQRGAAGVRSGVADALGRERHADGRHLPDRGRAPDDHLADAEGDLAGGLRPRSRGGIGEPPLVDQVQDAGVLAERRAEAGRGGRTPVRPARVGEAQHRGAGFGVEDPRRRLDRCALERLGGPGHGRGGLDEVARELAEEPAASEIDVGGRASGSRGAPGGDGPSHLDALRRPRAAVRPLDSTDPVLRPCPVST